MRSMIQKRHLSLAGKQNANCVKFTKRAKKHNSKYCENWVRLHTEVKLKLLFMNIIVLVGSIDYNKYSISNIEYIVRKRPKMSSILCQRKIQLFRNCVPNVLTTSKCLLLLSMLCL